MIFGMLMAFGVDVKNLSGTIPKVIFRIFSKNPSNRAVFFWGGCLIHPFGPRGAVFRRPLGGALEKYYEWSEIALLYVFANR